MIDAGQILRMCRKHLGWSIMQLSLESSVSTSTIQEIETGRRGCRLDTFDKILDSMGYEIEVLKKDE